MIGETNGMGICASISRVRAGGVYRLVDIAEEKETEITRERRSVDARKKQPLMQHARHRQRELRYHRVELGAVFGNHLIAAAHGADHCAQ